MRMQEAVSRAAAYSVALLLLAVPARAQETKPEQPAPPAVNSWTINCGSTTDVNKLDCLMSQTLNETQTGQRVLTVTIRIQTPANTYVMVFMLPHGIYLRAGATYAVDDGTKAQLAIQTADQNGSYAFVPLDDKLVATMKAGGKLNVGMETAQRAPVSLPVSLTGFAATYDKLVKMN